TDSDPYNLSETEINNAQNWAFRFHYQKTTCNGSAVYKYVTYNYAYFRAAWQPTDFLLMELQNLNNATENNLVFAGWDRSANTPQSGTGIHHPAGDVMKISFDYNNLISYSGTMSWTDSTISPVHTHWKVGYDNGTTEGGSSGSPLFNQNHRIVGQLHGGYSGCPPVSKWYGRFDKSWTGGGTNETRLSNWLDPMSSNVTDLDGMDPSCTVETIQNKVISTHTTINGCNIDVQNVTVKNGAKLTLDAEKETTINGPFEVETGAELEIK
ncbi:MAG: serine protease, partial [Bacteroidales bacterium]|nr:serine protease [Bacteroidales bacterium]